MSRLVLPWITSSRMAVNWMVTHLAHFSSYWRAMIWMHIIVYEMVTIKVIRFSTVTPKKSIIPNYLKGGSWVYFKFDMSSRKSQYIVILIWPFSVSNNGRHRRTMSLFWKQNGTIYYPIIFSKPLNSLVVIQSIPYIWKSNVSYIIQFRLKFCHIYSLKDILFNERSISLMLIWCPFPYTCILKKFLWQFVLNIITTNF